MDPVMALQAVLSQSVPLCIPVQPPPTTVAGAAPAPTLPAPVQVITLLLEKPASSDSATGGIIMNAVTPPWVDQQLDIQ
jgi:hypothetical protein